MNPHRKTLRLEQLVPVLAEARGAGKRVALCHGVFDLLHPGHIAHLGQARAMGDLLVVTVTPDRFVRKGPGRPAFTEQLRLETLAALECVDYVALNDWADAVGTIEMLRPDFYVKGPDYSDASKDITGKIVDERRVVESVGGSLRFTDGQVFSASGLVNRFFSAYPEPTQRYLERIRRRYDSDQIVERLDALHDLRVLVVGEAILDRYTYCVPLARPPKEFIVAAKLDSEETFAGGALATANHVAGICGEVTLVTCLGSDPAERAFIESNLRPNVRLCAVAVERPNIVKQRFLTSILAKAFELQRLDDRPLGPAEETQVARLLQEEQRDLTVVSDFGHGLLTDRLRELLCGAPGFLAVNTQTNSANMGFNPVRKYPRADYVCVDHAELRLTTCDPYSPVRALAARVLREQDVAQLMITQGSEGSLMINRDGVAGEAPALAVRVVDRVGAGDAFYAVTAPCVRRGYDPDLVGLIGNAAGALAVEIVGNRTSVDPVDLRKFLAHLLR